MPAEEIQIIFRKGIMKVLLTKLGSCKFSTSIAAFQLHGH